MFGDKHEKIRKAAAKKNTKVLIALLSDKDESIAVEAAKALGQCKDDDAFNALIPYLHCPKREMRIAAAKALSDIGNFHARAHISYQMQQETDEAVKHEMSAALAHIPEKM